MIGICVIFGFFVQPATSFVLSGLTAGAGYIFAVHAVNRAGLWGPISAFTTEPLFTDPRPPGPPTALSASQRQPSSFVLSWSTPGSNGGGFISHFVIDVSSTSGASFQRKTTVLASTQALIADLPIGVTLTVSVAALN